MTNISTSLLFFFRLAKAQSVLARRFDAGVRGLGFNELTLLYHLSIARDERLRRIDLAEKIGLTASAVVRLLLPMEKVGSIKREAHSQDARVSYVVLTPTGKRQLSEALEEASLLAEELLPQTNTKQLKEFTEFLTQLA